MLPYDQAGTGPAVLLLHAGIADRTMWREQLEPIAAAGYRVVAPDLPGFGEAPLEAGPQAPWLDVIEMIDTLGIAPAALVGNSFGGAVALRVAHVAPERLAALVLISAPPPNLEPSPQLDAAWAAEGEALERDDIDAAVQAVVTAWTMADSPPALRERIAAMQRIALLRQRAAGPLNEAPDPLERDPGALERVEVPALVAAGEHDMPDFRDGALLMADALPQARHAVIEGAGHLSPVEVPTAFRQMLLAFLSELDW